MVVGQLVIICTYVLSLVIDKWSEVAQAVYPPKC